MDASTSAQVSILSSSTSPIPSQLPHDFSTSSSQQPTMLPFTARQLSLSMPSVLSEPPFASLSSSIHQYARSANSLGMETSSRRPSNSMRTVDPLRTFSSSTSSSSFHPQNDDTLTLLPLQDETQGRKRKRDEMTSSPTGLDFLDSPPQHLHCPICQSVFNKPVIVNGCGHEFCDECLRRALSTSPTCPMCRQAINPTKPFATPLRRVQEEVDRLRVRCPFSQGGCDSVVSFGSLEAHVDTCPFAVIECHHVVHGCEWEGTRQGLAQHLAECQFEKMKGFTHKTSTEITELKSHVSMLQAEVKRLKVMENVMKTRGERLRELHKQKMGFGHPGVESQITVVRVAERGAIQWMFKVKTNTKLGRIQDILQLKRGKPVLLTCDGPLQIGGSVVDKNESLFDLGLAPSSVSSQNGVVLFAEIL
eukprot:c1713_g1_i1.p1 GENE.c1713_g1_i1~~c1713_g1_i1.p1  ORF type:complete len:420 (+),score=87.34 c1713_g1_i1:80-1339(+)